MLTSHVLARFTATFLAIAPVAAAAESRDTAPTYPELPIAKNYLHVSDVSLDAFCGRLKLPAERRADARRYIFRRMPVREFEKLMLGDAAALKRGHTDVSYRATKEYRNALEGCNWVSQQMAVQIVRDALGVYGRKFIRPDPVTAPLFAATTRRETEANIAGIEREVSLKEFLARTSSTFPLRPKDRFYFYRTAFGGGYLIARNNRLIKEDEGMFEY